MFPPYRVFNPDHPYGGERQTPAEAAVEICAKDGLSMAYSQDKIYGVLSLQSP